MHRPKYVIQQTVTTNDRDQVTSAWRVIELATKTPVSPTYRRKPLAVTALRNVNKGAA